jgi:acyl carrier protein
VSTRSVAEIEDWLLSHLRERLGPGAEEIDAHLPFSYYGLDSLDAVALAAELEEWLGVEVTPDVAWDYPTANAVAAHLGADRSTEGDPGGPDSTLAALLLELEAGDAAS